MHQNKTMAWVLPGLLFLAGCATTGSLGDGAASWSSDAVEANRASLRAVLDTLRDTNWDPQVAAMDTDALYAEYAPRIDAARDMDAVRAEFAALFRGIGQSHLNIIPRDLYDDLDTETADTEATPGEGVTGISLRPHDGAVYVTAVEADSPAARAGVQPGWRILAIDGKKLRPILARLDASLGENSMRTLIIERALSARLDGPLGEHVALRVDDGRRRHDLAIARALPRGEAFAFGNLPAVDTWIEHRWLEEEIGYIAFNYFMDPMRLGPAFEEAIQTFAGADGVIVDLRGNGGGIAGLAMGFAGWFITEQNTHLGTMHFRDADMRFVVNPRPGAYTGPLAILIDGCSASCSEIFAAGLRDLGRARLFGSTTAGAALPAHFMRLPNRDGFMYPVADYVSQAGDRLEGVGVVPDVAAPPDPAALRAGGDPARDAAVAWIRAESASPK